ncbi:MAG TPA: hypothetical protein VJ890_16945 [Vineibacter sp.]|nr:hypothetical protein [Vineibacter sp.]
MSTSNDAARIKALEARVADLESQLRARPGVERCSACGKGSFKVIKVNVAAHKRTLQCDNAACGHVERRRVDYHARDA